jgi:DNA-directed RNA polymerase II subunit RPB2
MQLEVDGLLLFLHLIMLLIDQLCCLLDLDKNSEMVDLFIPSIHDASKIFNQVNALQFISTFTKRQTISNTLEILMNAFLPHVGEVNFLDKAYYIGYMVYRMLNVYTNKEAPTNRDNFKYKRVELSGTLLYDLFR